MSLARAALRDRGTIRGVDLAFRFSSADVAEWLQRLSAQDRDMVTILRGLISEVAPGLPDPDALLKGSGKQMRHVKLTSTQSLPAPAIRQLLELAWPDGLARVQGRHGSKRR